MVSQEYEQAIKQCTDFISNAGSYLDRIHQHLNNKSMILESNSSKMKDTFSIRKSLLMEITNKWSEYNELKVLLAKIRLEDKSIKRVEVIKS